MQLTLWVAYPFPGPWQVPLHPPAAVLASAPLPTVQGAASIPMTASPRAWLSQSCCLRARASSISAFLYTSSWLMTIFDFCQMSCFVALPFYPATVSHLRLVTSLSASPGKCTQSSWLKVTAFRRQSTCGFSAPT